MDIWSEVVGFFALMWSYAVVKFLVAHIAFNVLVAIATSIYTNTFCLGKTGEFLYRKLLPYLIVFGGGAALGEAANLTEITVVTFIGIELMLFADLADNLKKLGIPIPDSFTKPNDIVYLEPIESD